MTTHKRPDDLVRRRGERSADAVRPGGDVIDLPDRAAPQLCNRWREICPLGQLARPLTTHSEHLGQLRPAGQMHQLRHARNRSSLTTCHLTSLSYDNYLGACHMTTHRPEVEL